MTQQQALDVLKLGHNVFLTGEPGAGKTFVLNKFIEHLRDHAIATGVTASTGIAATHIGGTTIHSWSGIGIKDTLDESAKKNLLSRRQVTQRIEKAKVLIIDEVSMLDGKRLDLIDQICRITKDGEKSFGGLQVVLTGDLFQLPPISKGKREEVDFVFKSQAWQDLKLKVCYIEEQHRADDEQLLGLLSAIRNGEIDESIYELLESCSTDDDLNHIPTRLYTHNIDVNAKNASHLAQIDNEERTFIAVERGNKQLVEALKQSCLAAPELQLKVDAEVMFVANNPKNHTHNGTRGVVIDFDSETGAPIVLPHNRKKPIIVDRHTWSIEDNDQAIAEYSQYPLRLAWAITVHKSQGMSLDGAEIDLGRSFEPGMGYVALSRVKSLSGLWLRGVNDIALRVHPEVTEFDIQLRRKSKQTSQQIENMKKSQLDELHSRVVGAQATFEKPHDPLLFDNLRIWRNHHASKIKKPAYIIASDATLKDLASKQPTNVDELRTVSGIGPSKERDYADDLLRIINDFKNRKVK